MFGHAVRIGGRYIVEIQLFLEATADRIKIKNPTE